MSILLPSRILSEPSISLNKILCVNWLSATSGFINQIQKDVSQGQHKFAFASVVYDHFSDGL